MPRWQFEVEPAAWSSPDSSALSIFGFESPHLFLNTEKKRVYLDEFTTTKPKKPLGKLFIYLVNLYSGFETIANCHQALILAIATGP